MDIALAKTFLEIAETGSFVAAAQRLNITQTAVSARIRTLEEHLGRRLFIRNKSGARLTAAGERFARHATTLVQVWDRARQQIALPQGRTDIASVGAELSLWNPILADWLVWMRQEAPQIAVRAEVDTPARLLEAIHNGSLDMAVLYDPPPQGGSIVVELLTQERLILATSLASDEDESDNHYVHVDWGPVFQASHHAAFPTLDAPVISISHGPLALLYVARAGGTGYFRSSALRSYLTSGQLRRVLNAPEFSYSVHLVYSSRTDTSLIERMRQGFRVVTSQDEVKSSL